MDLKEILDSAEAALKSGNLKYFLIVLDKDSEQVGACCNISSYDLAQIFAAVMEQDRRIVAPLAIALKWYSKEHANDNA